MSKKRTVLLPWQEGEEIPEPAERWFRQRRNTAMHSFLSSSAKNKKTWATVKKLLEAHPPGVYYKRGERMHQKPFVGNWHWWEFARKPDSKVKRIPAPPFSVPADAEPRFRAHLGGMHPADVMKELGFDSQDIAFLLPNWKASKWKERSYDERLEGILDEDWAEVSRELCKGIPFRDPDAKKVSGQMLTPPQKKAMEQLQRYSVVRRSWTRLQEAPKRLRCLKVMMPYPPGQMVEKGSSKYELPYVGSWDWWKWVPFNIPKAMETPPPLVISFDTEPRFRKHGAMHRIDIMREMGMSKSDIRFIGEQTSEYQEYDPATWEPKPYNADLDLAGDYTF